MSIYKMSKAMFNSIAETKKKIDKRLPEKYVLDVVNADFGLRDTISGLSIDK